MIPSFCVRFLSRINRRSLLLQRYRKILISSEIPHVHQTFCTLEQYNNSTATTEANKERVTFLKLSKFMKNENDCNALTKEQATLFMQCCGKISVYEAPANRIAMLNNLWGLLEANKFDFDVELYNVYVQVYTENKILIDCDGFLGKMQCAPNHHTYKLLLENVCERGDLEQVFFLLGLVKAKGFTVDEETFNCLVLGHTIHNGLEGGESVFDMMKFAEVAVSDESKFALIRGLIIKGDFEGLKTALVDYSIAIDEDRFLAALEDLSLNDRHFWLPELLKTTDTQNFSSHFPVSVQMLCIQLIKQNKYDGAFFVYKQLVKPSSESGYGKDLIRHMVKNKAPVAKIMEIVRDLKTSNVLALENAAEIALVTEYCELAWSLFKEFTYLRPHFFWPLLLTSGRNDGELGVLTTLENMHDLGVKADLETLEQYSVAFCNLSEPELCIKKLQNIGYTVKETLTPILCVLLSQQQLQKAQNLCDSYNVQIFAERLILPLVNNWKNSDNIQSITHIIQKFCESNPTNMQHLESFLIKIFRAAKSTDQAEKLLATLELLKQKKFYINPLTTDTLLKIMNKRFLNEKHFRELRHAVDSLQDLSITEEPSILPHPRDMTVEELECHLLELENKNMETRGVLRKLIQVHSSTGNHKRATELRDKFISLGYSESAGMKSSVMYNYVQLKDLPAALDLYQEIKLLYPRFKMDSFKAIDLAALLVENGKTEDALDVLNEEAKKGNVSGGRAIQKNCLNLLKSATDPLDLDTLFHTLIKCGYCKATNVILGPLVYIHIKHNDLKSAVNVYESCAKKFKATPQQLELLRATLRERQAELFEKAVNATEEVHGKPGAYLAVIAALAEEGMRESLKLFLVKTLPPLKREVMRRRYDRWVEERKLDALKTLESVLQKLSLEALDLPYVHLSIMRVYSLNNNCEGALAFWEDLVSEGGLISKEISTVLYNLLIKNKYSIPKNLEVQAQ